MTQQNDDKQEFRVVDKRRFTSEGEVKTGVQESQEQQSSPQSSPQSAVKSQMAPQKPAQAAKPEPKTKVPADPDAFDFSSLVISLATQALVMMGEVPNPESRSMNINLDAAKQTIDILVLLEEKTRGNLTMDEQKLLGEVLTNLQLSFVKKMEKR